jgi:hypothetical protein
MKKLYLLTIICIAGFLVFQEQADGPIADREAATPATATPPPAASRSAGDPLAAAFAAQRSDVIVEGQGTVSRLLADDRDGARHQRFILRLASGQTLLVAHNIDLAPRVASLAQGDVVSFKGEYEWNPQGGVLHWTHRDPAGRHVGGWLRHDGRTYQ